MAKAAFIPLLVFALAACAPDIRLEQLEGRNAKNNGFRIILDPSTPFRAAVLAQELYEAELKQNPAMAVLIRLDEEVRRGMELTGHEIEAQAALRLYGEPLATYRAKEAQAMRRGYGGLFAALSPADIVDAMAAREKEAASWVERNRKRLEAYR